MNTKINYSLFGENKLTQFVHGPRFHDEAGMRKELLHQGSLLPQFIFNFSRNQAPRPAPAPLFSRVVQVPLQKIHQLLVTHYLLPATRRFKNKERLAAQRLKIMDPTGHGISGVKARRFQELLKQHGYRSEAHLVETHGLEVAAAIQKDFFEKVVVEKPLIKRFVIEVEGIPIDVCLKGKPSTLSNGRWILATTPNDSAYEQLLAATAGSAKQIKEKRGLVLDLAEELEANIAMFNYPGVGDSGGTPHPDLLAKAYKAVLCILENEVKASHIIHCGWSIGGGVQSLGLDKWESRKGIRHVCIKYHSFSSLSEAAKGILGSRFGHLAQRTIQAMGWDINSHAVSRSLAFPEIIIQKGKHHSNREMPPKHCIPLSSYQDIVYDDLLEPFSTLGYALIQEATTHPEKKYYFTTTAGHNDAGINVELIAHQVRQIFQEKKKQTQETIFLPLLKTQALSWYAWHRLIPRSYRALSSRLINR